MKKNLNEYAANSEMEEYTGIVLDPDKNEFKVISGYFHDKKDFYEKMVKRGLVLRKCYEKAIWNWIQNNAPDDLIAYLMYSTAFSKWRGNNILSDYYVKLLNDIPALNRERRKGDPNSKGAYRKKKSESVIVEDNNMPEKKYYTGPNVDKEWATTRKVKLYPVTLDPERTPKFERDPKYVLNPIVTEITTFDTDNPKKRFDDPDFYRLIFKLLRIYKIGKYAAFDIVFEDDPTTVYRERASDLLAAYNTKNKNPYYRWGPKDNTVSNLNLQIKKLEDSIAKAQEENLTEDIPALTAQVNNLKKLVAEKDKESIKAVEYLHDDEKEELNDLLKQRQELVRLRYNDKDAKAKSNLSPKEYDQNLNKEIVDLTNRIQDLKTSGLTRYYNSNEYKYIAKPEANADAYSKLQSPAMSNPAFNGAAFDNFAAQMDRRNTLQKKVAQDMKRTGKSKFLDIDLTQKPIYNPNVSKLTKDDLNQAFSSERERNFNNTMMKAVPESPIDTVENSFKDAYDLSKNDVAFIKNETIENKLAQEDKAINADEKRALYAQYSKNLKSYQDDLYKTYSSLQNEYSKVLDTVEGKFVNDFITDANNYSDLSPSLLNDVIRVSKKDLKGNKSNFEFMREISNKPSLYADKLNFWYNKIKAQLDNIRNKGTNKKESAQVNDGVTTMYRTMPIGGQPLDTYQTNKGILPIGGMFLENEMAEASAHKDLHPDLFDGDKLKPDVREALLQIANKFKESLDLPFDPVNIYFTGSCANYNYNDQSDIDLHLVYDFERVGVAAEILSKFLQMAKKVFNTNYNITVKGLPVELGAEDLNKPLIATAVYSVQNDEWVRKPDTAEIEIAEPDLPYYNEIVKEIESAIQSKDSMVIGELWKMLGQIRKEGLESEGEFGSSNMLFKKLRNDQYLARLKDAYYKSVGDELSLESLEEIE